MPKARGSKKVRVAERTASRLTKSRRSVPPGDAVKRRTSRPLSDFAGILSPEAAESVRKAIEESRKERERLDRDRLVWLMKAFDRFDEVAALEAARRRARSAGLTRRKVRDILDEVKKEVWNRTYGDKKSRK